MPKKKRSVPIERISLDASSAERKASDDEVSISVADGSIVVSGASSVDVYSLDGTQVYGGAAGTVSGLPSGVYVVKAVGTEGGAVQTLKIVK